MITQQILTEKYRPMKLDEIIGQTSVIKRIKAFVKVGRIPHLLFSGIPGSGKTTTAHCIAREIFGKGWQINFLEINAGDERGIATIREKVKEFVETAGGFTSSDCKWDGKILLLDEIDSMTSDAQNALKRIMEIYSNGCSFILTCNNIGPIIEAIVSRCQVYRFGRLSNEEIKQKLIQIIAIEKLNYTDIELEAIIYCVDGDLRKAIGMLEVCESVGIKEIYRLNGVIEIERSIIPLAYALSGDFYKAVEKVEQFIIMDGYSGRDILKSMIKVVEGMDISEKMKAAIVVHIGETEYRICSGGDLIIQMKAFIANLMVVGDR